MTFHWNTEDYFPYLIKNFKTAILALEYLVDDIHVNKELTIKQFLCHCGSEDFLWGIVKLMSSENLRVSGNSAYVFGTIAESNEGIERIVGLLNNKKNPESNHILLYLVNLLKSSDYECLMNAAGTIGTISESFEGRSWLIEQPLLNEILELTTALLENQNMWVSSNAALVIARITIEDVGCEKLLAHSSMEKILQKLAFSLGCDNAGRGMNCAFAIGRICDNEKGRLAVLRIGGTKKLIASLTNMIEQNMDNGCTKNACYALSCLAANNQAYESIVEHLCFDNLVTVLCRLLNSIKDDETQWFAAMLLRVLSGSSSGCLKMKSIPHLWETLNKLNQDEEVCDDVREELVSILSSLKPIDKANPVRLEVKGSNQIYCEWDRVELKSKFQIRYLLFKDNECVYNGTENSYLVNNLKPHTQYSFHLQILVVETNERSQPSECVKAITDESVPSEPLNLRVTGASTSIISLAWDPPEAMNGTLKFYQIFKEEQSLDQTNELSFVIKGLQPSSSYQISVCAVTYRGRGEMASINASTCSLGDTLPEKPVFGLVGRREILVRWQPPQVINGRLTRYDLNMNGKCVYSGVALEYQVVMLRPDTEYKFQVVAITTEGKCRSKISKVRTLKDEYDPDRTPLYPGVNKEKSELILERKRPSIVKELTKPNLLVRQKTKIKPTKQPLSTTLCNEFNLDSNAESSNFSFLPPVSQLNSNSFNDQRKNSQLSDDANEIYKILERTSQPQSRQMHNSNMSLQRGKTTIQEKADIRSTSKQGRQKTILSLIQNSESTGSLNNKTQPEQPMFVQPRTFNLNIQDMQRNFPVLPLMANISFASAGNLNMNRKSVNLISPDQNSNKAKFKSDDLSLNYKYLLKNYNKEKTEIPTSNNIAPFVRSNTFVNSRRFINQIDKLSK